MKFDEIAKELGWEKPYEEVPLWYKCHEGKCIGKFAMNEYYEQAEQHPHIVNEEFVKGCLNMFPTSIFKEENKDWILPLLATDYFHDTYNFGKPPEEKQTDMELKYAKMAIDASSGLQPEAFSREIREQLKEYKNSKI